MGLFDRFKKKQEQPPAPAPVQRNSGKRTGQTKVADKDTEELMEAFDYAVDAMYRAIEAKDGGPPLPPLPLKKQPAEKQWRLMDLPAVDSQGKMIQEIREIIDKKSREAGGIWGGVDQSWSPETEADRFYDSFPSNQKELEELCVAGINDIDEKTCKKVKIPQLKDDVSLASLANTMYGLAIHTITSTDIHCKTRLPLCNTVNGDPDGRLWSINDDGLIKPGNPEISTDINWLANIHADRASFENELEVLEDTAFQAMVAGLLDAHYAQIKKIFDRFSGYAQRIERIKETNIICYGLPALAPPAEGKQFFRNKLEDYDTIMGSHFTFAKIADRFYDQHPELTDRNGRLFEMNTYLEENYDFDKPSVYLPRLYGYLALAYLTDYAIKNMKSYYNFNKPKYDESIKRCHADIMNYLSFRGYSASDESGTKYHTLLEKIIRTLNERSKTLFDTIITHTWSVGDIKNNIAPVLVAIARRLAPEVQIRRGLNDAITRRMASQDLQVINTQQANYFVPWSKRSNQILEDAENGNGSPGQ